VKVRVLIADADRANRESLARMLESEGYAVTDVADGAAALSTTRRVSFDALIIDVTMPGVDGLGVCRVLRTSGDYTPILVLTARAGTADRVAGLDAGADDYLLKPFELDELLARLRALLRRVSPAPAEPARRAMRLNELVVDQAGRRVWWRNEEVELAKTEFDLLELLVANEGTVLDRAMIHQRIWGYELSRDSKKLAVYISCLRHKLAKAGAPGLIHTVRGVGYSIRPV
jgi:two-component system response regulator MprA